MDALEPAVEQHELVGEAPLHRARHAVVEPHGDSAARPLRDPLAHRDAVRVRSVLPLHVIEAVDGIVGLVERPDVATQKERRVRQIGGQARIGLPVAAERRRQRRVRRAVAVGLPASIAVEPVGAGVRSEEMIERAVLHEEHDDVIDRRVTTVQ